MAVLVLLLLFPLLLLVIAAFSEHTKHCRFTYTDSLKSGNILNNMHWYSHFVDKEAEVERNEATALLIL